MELVTLDRPKIAVRNLGRKGRGVVAVRDIPAYALIERVPVLIVPDEARPLVDRTVVFAYLFMWEPERSEQDLYEHRGRAAIALGVPSLVNHSDQPTARVIRDFAAEALELRSLCHIRAGQEVTIDYEMDLWFVPE